MGGRESQPFRVPGREWSLRQQLFALFLVFSLGPLVVTNTWGYLQSRHYGTGGELRAAHNVAALEAAGVLHEVWEQHLWLASIVAGNHDLFGLLRALNRPGGEIRTAVQDALMQHLAAKAHESSVVRELFVLSPSGSLVDSSLRVPTAPVDLSESACFRRGRQVAAIDGVDFQGDDPVLLVSAPVRDEMGDFLGVLCGHIDFQMHLDVAQLDTGRPAQTAVYLLDKEARVIDESHDDSLGVTRAELLGHPLRRVPGAVNASEPWQGRVGKGDDEVLAAWAPIPELGWGVLVETPTSSALATFDILKRQAVAFGGLLSFMVVAAILVVARRISQPMLALSEAASLATQGSFGVTVPRGGTIEVSNLARAFNTLGLAVKESHSLLEERIAARTRELQRSQEFSERLLNSIDQPVLVIDQTLTFVAANAAALRRYGADLVGRRCQERDVCQRNNANCAVCTTLLTGQPASAERIERIGEKSDAVSGQAFPVLGVDGKVDAVIELRRVITDERRLQAQMVHHEKMSAFGLLAAGVAHEVGNPLAAIQSQVRLAQDAPSPARTEETLRVVAREVQRITGLLRELVSFARQHDEEAALIAVDKVIDDVVRLVRYDPRANKTTIEVDHDPGAVVRAKEDHMVQILLNLALNALDAMPSGGTLRMEVTAAPGTVLVRVRDTGVGIGESAREHIFEPFFTTKARGQGTGLGLFVTQALVKGLGGGIEVLATGAQGTVFQIHFPAAAWRSRAS
jgi:C4-dicarboxylate-specific signal transduction histidine kinase